VDGVSVAGSPVFDIFGHQFAETISFADVYDQITIDYALSTAGVKIDLETEPQHGGFAEGDSLVNVMGIIGSNFQRHYKRLG